VGCSDCVVACQTENNVPVGFCRDWVVEVVDGTYPNVSIELRSERCNHCDNSPCVRCCPTGASHFEDGGIVLVDHNKCIGCGACIRPVLTTHAILILTDMSTNAHSVFTGFAKVKIRHA
jgi:Fe-S-cluster-containing dehydrogenase component